MEWCVVKTGIEMFDALHAYGLGILAACAGKSPVELEDTGIAYRLRTDAARLPGATVDILDQILALPCPGAIAAVEANDAESSTEMANLDGLLAALFTTPGPRLVSVADLVQRRRAELGSTESALAKVDSAVQRCEEYAKKATRASGRWLDDLLRDYDSACPRTPTPVRKGVRDLGVPMTIDPALSHSVNRPISDGLIACKKNVAVRETRYAALLALVGAARFLRAQRVTGSLVNFYVPLPASITLFPDTALPTLSPAGYIPDQAVALQAMVIQNVAQVMGADWHGLAYQVLQTQGAKQSISLDRGCFDNRWLARVENCAGQGLISSWKRLLGTRVERAPFEMDNLVEAVTGQRVEAWLAHLRDISIHLHSGSKEGARRYAVREIREVTAAMIGLADTPLSAVLEREEGTLRFGHALRLLGRQTPAPLWDIVDALDGVQTCDQLIRVLAQAVQECAVAGARTQFIIIPSDDDLRHLLDDVDRYGARTVAGLLTILSALRYPRRTMPDLDSGSAEPVEMAPDEEEGTNDD